MRAHGLPVPPFAVVTDPASLRADFSAAERFAVRSTFEAEDGAALSFAGQFETLLNVPRAKLPEAISRVRESYASSYAAYAQAHGLPDTAVAADAPVIVQEMVDADCAGVLFTANPDGQLNEIVIVVGAGLGNAVVEDRTDTTTYFYNKDDALSCYERSGDAPLLAHETLSRLIELGLEVERLFSAPMDVEFAVKGDTVWLLQARPITTLPGGETIVLDNSNIVESYPDLTLPLSKSFVKEIYYRIFKSLLQEVSHRDPIVDALDGELRDMVDTANGRVYYRISNWYGVLRLMPFSGWFIRIWQQMLGVEHKSVTAAERRVPVRVKATLAWELMKCILQTPKRMDALCDFYDRYAETLDRRLAAVLADDGAKTPRLLEIYNSMLDDILARWHVTLINDVYAFLFTYLAGKRSQSALADIRNLESMQPVRHILALVETARTHGMDSAAYRDAKADFIAAYGDRCLGELKLETHTYRTHPALVDDFVRARLDQPTQLSTEATNANRRREGFFVRRAKLGIYNRERSRMDRTRIFGTIRAIFRAVGEELYRAGRIDDPEDVFYLPIPVLEAPDGADLRQINLNRKADYAMYAVLPAYSRLVFDGAIRNKRLHDPALDAMRGSDTLTGVPAAPGSVTAEALVVAQPDLSLDTRGKILVTRSTDPGWVFLIENAAGIIAEKGSLLSHTAIITRELHKPSMVNVKDACRRIRTGDLVTLDSTAGTIQILNRTE